MIKLIRKENINIVNEKFALQEYEGKIRDTLYEDLDSLNKCAIPITMMLYKWDIFCLNRLFMYKDFTADVFFVFYTLNKENNVASALSANTSIKNPIPPSKCGGFAREYKIVVYIPVNIQYSPFGGRLTRMKNGDKETYRETFDVEDKTLEIANKYFKNIKDAFIIVPFRSKIDTASLLRKHKEAIEEYKKLIPAWFLKEPKKLHYNRNNVLEILKHELTHVLDENKGSKKNYYTTIDTADKYLSSDKEDLNTYRLDLEKAIDILYYLWSYTEFNAYQQTFSNSADISNVAYKKRNTLIKKAISNFTNKHIDSGYIGRPYSNSTIFSLNNHLKELSKYLTDIGNNNSDAFWDTVKEITSKGSYDTNRKNRIKEMSSKQFKTYFIKTTNKLIEKFKEKTVKNLALQNDYNNDILNVAKQVKDSITENLSKNKYSKDSPFNFVLSFDYYFKDDKQSFPVKMIFNAPPEKDMREGKSLKQTELYREARVDLQCRPIKLNQKNIRVIDVFNGSDLNSFYELYKELTTKQRKTYLDKIAVQMSDDLVKVMGSLLNIRGNFDILIPPWER